MAKILFIAALVSAAVVLAQTPPDVTLIPSACATQCASVIQVASLCNAQFNKGPSDTTDLAGCFCNALPSADDQASCGSCLGENNAAALQTALSTAAAACPTAVQQCFFQCSFDTCPAADVACQCSQTYLSNIFNCASCNSVNGNTGATTIPDFEALKDSCRNQNYSGAMGDFATEALPSPTGQDAYVAPSLTGTGGGEAATGTAVGGAVAVAGGGNPSGSAPAASASATDMASASDSAPTSMSAARSAMASSVRSAAASGSARVAAVSGSGAAAAAASASPSGAAGNLKPAAAAFGGVLALAVAVLL